MLFDPRIRRFLGLTLVLNVVLAGYRFGLGPASLTARRAAQCNNKSAQHQSFSLDVHSIDMPINRLPDSNLNVKKARITHVVVPFHKEQESKVLRNLQVWKNLPPCSPVDTSQKARYISDTRQESVDPFFLHGDHPAGPLGCDISLTFFCSADFDIDLESRLVKAFLSLPDRVTQCFTKVALRFGDFLKDTDSGGTLDNKMIQHMFHGKLGLVEPYYVLYMNPDVLPIRPNWLATLDALTRWPSGQFWIKGSLSRGKSLQQESDKRIERILSINTNAIYNLRDSTFHHFWNTFVHNKLFGRDNFDLAIYKQLMSFSNYEMSLYLAHLFQYTEAISDLWPSDYSASELKATNDITVLVHGNNQKL